MKFGPQENLPPIEVPLSEGNSLLLRGQIDRIDCAVLGEEIYLRIFDYKSREAHVDLNQIYHGLDLQLLAYLDAALQGAEILLKSSPQLAELINSAAENLPHDSEDMKKVQPAGFLYFPVLEPQLKAKTLLYPEQLEKERIKAVKVRGYLLADRQVLLAMDRNLENSNLLGIKLNRGGDFKKGSPILTKEQFTVLRKHLQNFLRCSGEELLKGNISITPYRQGKNTACQFCSYKSLCHFDPYLPENKYRNLPLIQDEDFWNRVETDIEQSTLVSEDVLTHSIDNNKQKTGIPERERSQKPVEDSPPSKNKELVWLEEEQNVTGKEENHE